MCIVMTSERRHRGSPVSTSWMVIGGSSRRFAVRHKQLRRKMKDRCLRIRSSCSGDKKDTMSPSTSGVLQCLSISSGRNPKITSICLWPQTHRNWQTTRARRWLGPKVTPTGHLDQWLGPKVTPTRHLDQSWQDNTL